jgi:predicted acyltransferase (DUF342 family)
MKKGSVLVAIIIILTGLMTISVGLTSVVTSTSIKIQRQYKRLSALAYAEAGVNKGLWKINTGDLYYATGANGILETDISGGQYRVKVYDCPGVIDCKYIESTGYLPTEENPDATKTVRVKISGIQLITNINFNFSVQSDANEVELRNNSTVKGSIFSNGKVGLGTNTLVTGNTTSAGSTPTTSYIGSKGTINGNATAYTVTGTTVKGAQTTGAYPDPQSMPISSDELEDTITAWEAVAATGYNSPGSVSLTGNQELGPAKINGDLYIDGDLKVNGVIWVNGNITIAKSSHVYLNSSFENNSGVIIADHKSDRLTKGKISIGPDVVISGTQKDNPKTTSYLLMLSTKTSTTTNWNTDEGYAIDLTGVGVLGGVYYAPFGSYHQKNHGLIRAVACNGFILDQNATIDYDGNWGNSGISTGPAGKWTITEWLILN